MDVSAPKKISSLHPPKIPQTSSRPLGPAPLETPPPPPRLGFSRKDRPPTAPRRLGLALPPPRAEKIQKKTETSTSHLGPPGPKLEKESENEFPGPLGPGSQKVENEVEKELKSTVFQLF